MYITKEWFLSAEHFKFPNLEGYNDEEIIYSIEIAEEWINQVITGNLIDEDLKEPNPKLKIVENLLQPYNPKDEKQVMLARDIKKAVGRATTFVLETGFNFITGSFSASIGDRSVNEVINFESSKEYIEDYIKTLLAKWYEPRLITQSASVQYDLPKVDGGLIDGQEKPISYNEARNLFNELFKDKFNGTAPIKVEWTVPNDPNKGITISCDDCNKGSGGTDCQEVGKCPSVESKLDTNKLQDEFLKLWDQDNSDITITKGSLKGKIKADILKPYLFKSEAEITYEKQTDHQFDFEALNDIITKKQNKLKAGKNIDITNDVISASGGGAGAPTWDDIKSLPFDKLKNQTRPNYYGIYSYINTNGKWFYTLVGIRPDGKSEDSAMTPDFAIWEGKEGASIKAPNPFMLATKQHCQAIHPTEIDPKDVHDRRIINGKDFKALRPTFTKHLEYFSNETNFFQPYDLQRLFNNWEEFKSWLKGITDSGRGTIFISDIWMRSPNDSNIRIQGTLRYTINQIGSNLTIDITTTSDKSVLLGEIFLLDGQIFTRGQYIDEAYLFLRNGIQYTNTKIEWKSLTLSFNHDAIKNLKNFNILIQNAICLNYGQINIDHGGQQMTPSQLKLFMKGKLNYASIKESTK